MAKRKVIWSKQATFQFNIAIKYIRRDSAQNADKIREKILNKINELSDDKVVHRRDPKDKAIAAHSLPLAAHRPS